MEARLDKLAFKKQSFVSADHNMRYWRSRPPEERLQAAYHLSLRVYGYDPANPPSMEKSAFSKRKHLV